MLMRAATNRLGGRFARGYVDPRQLFHKDI